MVARFIGFLLLMLSGAAVMVAQVPYTGRVVDDKGAPIQDVNVMLYRNEAIAMGFGFTDADGRFSVRAKGDTRPVAIGFVLLGYEARRIDIEEFRNGAEVVLKSVVFELREVSVRPDRIRRQNDTLIYNVSSFKLSQDRSIADVIRKMPGLEVSKNGTISFQGTPINKFYIEGMDLMGSKYAQASENINADMIGSVQVLQNHQPINSLKGLRFSDQAALNITLKENVKNVWSGIVDVGVGTALQDSANLLYNTSPSLTPRVYFEVVFGHFEE
ncbi:carboxypeptidase-like regulatory domain-containing protein [Porphyromonas levii]|uniref:carboxypeptidase-like regulatory domain-containing protein n=1 Tax=Porphyromonas levii TaxID=28114 RepID=UPI00036E9D41|nr:carboxypeptidase-like regulatory domain-containing protein [Porphyromonas levii]